MSNTTRQRVRLAHQINLQNDQDLSLEALFGGPRGRVCLQETLDQLPTLLKEQGTAKARPLLAWQVQKQTCLTGIAASARRYRLVLQGDQLHEKLRESGGTEVTLELEVAADAVRVRCQSRFSTSHPPATAEAQEGLARTSHRAINQLIGLTQLLHVREQLHQQQHARQKLAVAAPLRAVQLASGRINLQMRQHVQLAAKA